MSSADFSATAVTWTDWYGAFDAFLLTSENEGTPVVAIEALAAAAPWWRRARVARQRSSRDGESGYLAPVGDTRALAARLHELATTPGLAAELGDAGARDMRHRFSSETMADAVDALYRRVLAGS